MPGKFAAVDGQAFQAQGQMSLFVGCIHTT